MIKLFDFLYYFMYQLNRRGYKTHNYDNARFGLVGFLFFPFILFSSKLIEPFTLHFFDFKISNNVWAIISIVITLFGTYYYTDKFYGSKGTRRWVVAYYDKNTNIKSKIMYYKLSY